MRKCRSAHIHIHRTLAVLVLLSELGLATLRAPETALAQAAPSDCAADHPHLSSTSPAFEAASAVAADSFAALAAREPAPGASIAVVVNGDLAWSATHGLADVRSNRPVCSDTRFRTGSVSKIVTAVAVLRLVDAGRIDLDADVREIVPAIANQPYPITVRQLAGHLGGIRHYRSAEEYLNTRHYDRVADALPVFANDSLISLPGTEYHYSSYGYNLLGAALGVVADKPYAEAVRELVLDPLGLHDTSPEASVPADVFATPYSVRDNGLVPSPSFDPSDRLPSGGWAATAADLASLGYALVDPGFLSEASQDLVLESQRTGAGEETGTSIGVRIGTDPAGRPILHHGGTSVGGRAFLLVYPEAGVSIAILMNGPAEYAEEAVERIAEPFLAP